MDSWWSLAEGEWASVDTAFGIKYDHAWEHWYIVSAQYMLVMNIIFITKKKKSYPLGRAGVHPLTLTDQPLPF